MITTKNYNIVDLMKFVMALGSVNQYIKINCLALTYLSLGAFWKTTNFCLKSWQSFILLLIGFCVVHFESHKEVSIGIPIISFCVVSKYFENQGFSFVDFF